jgi:ribosomal protein S27AE
MTFDGWFAMNKNCPACEAAMTLGELGLGQKALGILTASMALPHLFFSSKKEEKRSILSWSEKSPPAWRCGACGTIVFLGRADRDQATARGKCS